MLWDSSSRRALLRDVLGRVRGRTQERSDDPERRRAKDFTEILINEQKLKPAQRDEAKDAAVARRVNLGEAIVELGFSKSDEVKAATINGKIWWPRTAA